MSLLGEILDLLTFWRREKREAARAAREEKASHREDERFTTERRQLAIQAMERLRDNPWIV